MRSPCILHKSRAIPTKCSGQRKTAHNPPYQRRHPANSCKNQLVGVVILLIRCPRCAPREWKGRRQIVSSIWKRASRRHTLVFCHLLEVTLLCSTRPVHPEGRHIPTRRNEDMNCSSHAVVALLAGVTLMLLFNAEGADAKSELHVARSR